MKYIKYFETEGYKIFSKGDIILEKLFNILYLVVGDAYYIDDYVKIFFIGKLYGDNASLIFNTKTNNFFHINNNTNILTGYSILNEKEKEILFESIPKFTRYIDVIKKETGIDLRNMNGYQEYMIKKEMNKYNI